MAPANAGVTFIGAIVATRDPMLTASVDEFFFVEALKGTPSDEFAVFAEELLIAELGHRYGRWGGDARGAYWKGR